MRTRLRGNREDQALEEADEAEQGRCATRVAICCRRSNGSGAKGRAHRVGSQGQRAMNESNVWEQIAAAEWMNGRDGRGIVTRTSGMCK